MLIIYYCHRESRKCLILLEYIIKQLGYYIKLYKEMYTICFINLINNFKVAFVYYLNYTIGIKEVDSSKYN